MPFEVAHTQCPLCKRQVPANLPDYPLSTRLCEPCQTMVLKAFPGASSVSAVRTTPVQQNGARATVIDLPALAHLTMSSPAPVENGPAYASTSEHEAESQIRFDSPDS